MSKTKTLSIKLLNDSVGEYAPFCDFIYHRGISLTPTICEERNCRHYVKLYLEENKIRKTEQFIYDFD